MMLFKSNKRVRAEKERAPREEANLRQRFLQLPAELRNQIYEHAIPSNEEVKRKRHSRRQCLLPALLHVSRRIREEVFPLFYGRNLVTIVIQHLTLHRWSILRIQSCANLLPDTGTTAWRLLRVESSARCFHDDGFAVMADVDVFIDRGAGTVTCHPRSSQSLHKCCQLAQKAHGKRLVEDIRKSKLHERDKKLRPLDFEKLAQRMDENRADWPMSPRRVVPKREWR